MHSALLNKPVWSADTAEAEAEPQTASSRERGQPASAPARANLDHALTEQSDTSMSRLAPHKSGPRAYGAKAGFEVLLQFLNT